MGVQELPGSGKRGALGKAGLEFQGIPGSRKKGGLGAGMVGKDDGGESHPGKDDGALGNGGDGHLGGVQGGQVVKEGIIYGAGQDRAQVRDVCGDSTVTPGTRGSRGGGGDTEPPMDR